MRSTVLVCLVSLLGASSSGVAQDAPAPPPGPIAVPPAAPGDLSPADSSAKGIIDRFIEVTGGRQAWLDLKSLRGLGRLEIIGTQITGSVAIYQTATTFRRSVDTPGLGSQVTIRNGERAWQVRPDGQVRVVEGPDLEQLIRDRHFNPLLHTSEIYESMEVMGVELVDVSQAWKIRCVPIDQGAGEEIRFFDVATGFQVKIAEFGPKDNPGIPTEIFPSDYRQVGQVLVPFETTIGLLRSRMRIVIDAMQADVELSECLFAEPAAAAVPSGQ